MAAIIFENQSAPRQPKGARTRLGAYEGINLALWKHSPPPPLLSDCTPEAGPGHSRAARPHSSITPPSPPHPCSQTLP